MAAQLRFRGAPTGVLLLLVGLGAACASSLHRTAGKEAPSDSVSVGYGKQARGDVTGAVASVNPEAHGRENVLRLEQLVEGRLAGVEVIRVGGDRISLRIRGTGSVNSGTEPLYVIDGMKVHAETFSDAMAGISPSDVARIEVLKDAGATAIYGSQGANGVVLVTTRRGK